MIILHTPSNQTTGYEGTTGKALKYASLHDADPLLKYPYDATPVLPSSNTPDGWEIYASKVNGTNYAYKAFWVAKKQSDYWESGGVPQYIQWHCLTRKLLIRSYCFFSSYYSPPCAWQLLISQDGLIWTVIDDATAALSGRVWVTRTLPKNLKSAAWYRLNFTKGDSSNNTVTINGLHAYRDADAAAANETEVS